MTAASLSAGIPWIAAGRRPPVASLIILLPVPNTRKPPPMLDGGRIGPSPGHDYAQSYPLGGIPCRSAQTGHNASALRCCLDGSRRHPGTVSGTRSPAPDPRLEPPARSAFAARSYPGLSSVAKMGCWVTQPARLA